MKNPGVTLNSAFLRPRSRGTVRLASADPKAAPLIDPNYWEDPYDRECAIKGLRLAREILRQPALKPFVLAERLPGDNLEQRRGARANTPTAPARPITIPSGTCAMGTGPRRRRDAGPQVARDRGPARRRRLGDAVRAVLQHQRADDHGGGKGLGPHPRQGAAAAGGALSEANKCGGNAPIAFVRGCCEPIAKSELGAFVGASGPSRDHAFAGRRRFGRIRSDVDEDAATSARAYGQSQPAHEHKRRRLLRPHRLYVCGVRTEGVGEVKREGGLRRRVQRLPYWTATRPTRSRATISFMTAAVPSPISRPITSRMRC